MNLIRIALGKNLGKSGRILFWAIFITNFASLFGIVFGYNSIKARKDEEEEVVTVEIKHEGYNIPPEKFDPTYQG